MTVTCNIPTQTVALEISPAEVVELTEAGRAHIKQLFEELIARVKEQLAGLKSEVKT